MSSSTALLPKPGKKDCHHIFLCVCHSACISINQRMLVAARGVIASYMLIVFMVLLYNDIWNAQHGWLIPFEMSNGVYLMQLIYHLITFVWAFMHLHFLHHASTAPSHSARLQKLLSPPCQTTSTKSKVLFSVFYTAAMTFPHVVTIIHWMIIASRKQNTPVDLLGQDWLMIFVVLNKFGINSAIALIENLVLNSIKRQEPTWGHITGLTMISLLYVFWAYIGNLITGEYAYFFLDFQEIGWEHFAAAVVILVGLVNTLFAFNYGLTGLREMLTKHSDDRIVGYARLPQ